jgi:two-component system sensor histidine kinase NreB
LWAVAPEHQAMPNNNLDKYFLASIVESSHDSIITINLDMEITSWNRGAEELYGYPASEAIGKQLTELTLPKDFQQLLIKIAKIKASKKVEVFESERVGKDKSHMILEVVVSPVLDPEGEIIGLSTIARDLTARRVAEKAMHDKDVLHRLIIAQEDERSRISRDLHDELGQQMTALRFAVERAKDKCSDDELRECITAIDAIAEAMDKSIDFLAWELRPAQLEGVGLAAAVENYLRQWSHHAGVETELLSSGIEAARLTPRVETNLYRIVQEALNNTHKHAKATRVDIILEHRDDSIILVIVDDGAGFSIRNKRKRAKGLGLTGMSERASLIGGTLDLESAPGRGTTIHVKLPVAPKRKRKAIKAAPDTNWG